MPLSSPNFEYTTTNIPAFLSKLWTLVEDTKYDELIAWDSSGFSFHVFDQTRFAREILPRFFKHNNMASFIRQLNMYGFRKVNSIDHGSLKNEKEDMEFHHPYFIRGKEQFLEFIKRKVPDIKVNTNQTANVSNLNNQTALSVQFPQIKPEELNKVLDDVNVIKSKQKMVDDSLFNVKKENEALWKEISTLRQKHHHQQQIVNKLIHFLVHLVNPSSLGLKRARPLMIDSHSNNLSNDDNDNGDFADINGIDEDDEEYIDSATCLNLRNGTNGVNSNGFNFSTLNAKNQPRHHIVELQDDDEDESEDSTTTTTPNGKRRHLSKSNLNYINEAEIETINISKNTNTTNSSNDAVINSNIKKDIDLVSSTSNQATDSQQPPAKKVKTVNSNMNSYSKNEITTVNLYHPNALTDLKNSIENINHNKSISVNDQEFLDANLFLNTSGSPNAVKMISSPIGKTSPTNIINSMTNSPVKQQPQQQQQQQQQQQIATLNNQQVNSPIVTTPASPLDSTSKNPLFLSENNANNIIDLSTVESIANVNNNYKRTISSSNQMNDHVESLQLDLNSIKELLTQSSFNQIDPYTINNLFSPIILDQMENEQYYLEPPLQSTDLNINSNMSNGQVSNTSTAVALTAGPSVSSSHYSTNTPSSQVSSSTLVTTTSNNTNHNSANNGKIVGNELIQYEPFNASDFFQLEDLFSTSEQKLSTKNDPPSAKPSSTSDTASSTSSNTKK